MITTLEAVGTDTDYSFETLALHAGTTPDPVTGAMLTPIYQTTTYRQEAVGKDKGFKYSRSGNPTVSALERRLAAIEGAEFATCYSTGLAATTALFLALFKSGDRVVSSQAVYGGTVSDRAFTALTDTRFYGLNYNIPSLCFGAKGAAMHGFNEYVELESLRKSTKATALFIAEWCGVEKI